MRTEIKSLRFWPPLPLVQGERMACRAVALRRREVRGSKTVRALKSQIFTLPSPKPTPLPSLALARPSLPKGEKGEANQSVQSK